MLTFLTSGTRIGASAAEKLDLFQKDALHTFRTYPEGIKDPLVAFRQGVDAAGQALTEEQREGVMAELPDAFRRSSLLLEALAREK